MVGLEDWDTVLPDPTVVLRLAAVFLELLRAKHGTPSWQKGLCVRMRLAGDVSDRAYITFLPDVQLTNVTYAPFTLEEVDCMARGIFTSTERELRALRHAIDTR